ncbi:toxin-antitoxin system YwqK family antitoxin, partial [Arcobacter sp. CECT 8985]|uniref:toxin-antitoxin system YwqK family antitoxin n=1 Tax=Arcobacter sp. CECT 8985 TaxID=1935424 RepID=UPI00102539D8
MIKKILIVCFFILSVSYSKEKKELFYEDNQNSIKVYYIEDNQNSSARFEMYNKNNKLINSYVARKIDLGFYSIIGKDYIFVYVNDKNKNDNKIEFFDPYSNILIGKEEKINENTVIQELKIPIYSDDIYISTKRKLKNGQIEGIQTIKNVMDKSITKLNFIKGKKQGSMIKIFNDGEKIKCNYKNDKREGLCSYFYKNGELKRETNYVNDKKDGTLKQFSKGKITSITNYRNGKKYGKFIEYYENTNIIKIAKNYKYGKLDGDSFEYFKTGKKKNKKTYRRDKLIRELIFNPLNEKVIKKISFNGYANKEGKMIKYFSNGKVNLIYNYKNNNKYGVQKEFYENKVLKEET